MIKKNIFWIFNIALSAAYISFLWKYYHIKYVTYDWFIYRNWAENNEPSRDTLSSLFIDISRTIMNNHYFAFILSLFMLAAAIFLINASIYRFLPHVRTKYKLLLSAATYSWGIWFSFYQKLYYDFPFTAFCYGITLFLLSFIIDKDFYHDRKTSFLWGLFYLMCGFTLSWKAYNIFPVAGLIFIVMLYKKNLKKDFKIYCIFFAVFLLGYLLGMYHLITDFQKIVSAIINDPKITNMMKYDLFHGSSFMVDQIDLGFFKQTVSLVSFIILLTIPLVTIKDKRYLLLAATVFIGYLLYVQKLSSVHSWHSFPYALFLITLVIFYIKIAEKSRIKILTAALLTALCFQLVNNYKTIRIHQELHAITFDMINYAKAHKKEIFKEISDITGEPIIEHAGIARTNIARFRLLPKEYYYYHGINAIGLIDYIYPDPNRVKIIVKFKFQPYSQNDDVKKMLGLMYNDYHVPTDEAQWEKAAEHEKYDIYKRKES